MAMSGTEIIKEELKKGLSGVYFFYGDEDYMKQYYLHEAEKQVIGDRSSLNFIRLTDDEFTLGAFEEALGSASVCDFTSLFAVPDESTDTKAMRLIELYEVDYKGLKSSELTTLTKLLREKVEDDTVVIIYSTASELPEDSKAHQSIIKELSKVATAVRFPYETDARLCSWMTKIASKSKVVLAPELARLILERVGHNMLILKNEVEKLISYSLSRSNNVITRDDVMAVVVSNKEISPFDFTNALMRRDAKTAFYILDDMKAHGEEAIVILSTVSRVIGDLIRVRGCMDSGMTRAETAAECSMHEYKVKLYAEQVKNVSIQDLFMLSKSAFDADVKLKSSPVDSFTVLERLICELVMI